MTPYNLRRELHEKQDVAVAIVAAAFIVGMAIVIAAARLRIPLTVFRRRFLLPPSALLDSRAACG